MLRKYYSADTCRDILLAVLDILSVLSVDERKIRMALQNEAFKDFEDCLQAECGQDAKADYIVTRNAKDFANSEIPCLSPGEVRTMFPQEA